MASVGDVELWELAAREHIRDTLARYTWSGDAGKVDDLALAFAPDGMLEIRGEEPLRGRDAIAARLGGVKRIVRHNLANIRFTAVSTERAAVSSYFTVVTEIGLDHYGRYRDEFARVGDQWLIAHRFVFTDWAAPNSTMVG